MKPSWILVLLPALVAAMATGDREAAPTRELTWWTTDGLEKVRPFTAPGPGREVALFAARNETESFQLVLDAPGSPRQPRVEGIDVEVADLVATSGARIAGRWISVYRVADLDLARPSSVEGAPGRWPDPLLPRRDVYAGERRNAFPFALARGSRQTLWFDVHVPVDAEPGHYRGELRISARGEPSLQVPIAVEVRPFRLPSTSSLRSSFGFSGLSALRGHRGGYTDDAELIELSRIYLEAGLRHRVSLHGGSMRPPGMRWTRGSVALDWSHYDREMAAALDGTLLGEHDPLPGARLTSVDVRTPPHLGPEEKVRYWAAWTARFQERSWLDRLFLYLWDEPQGPSDYKKVLREGRLVRQAASELPILLTEQRVSELAEVVDLWVPLIQCFDDPAAAARAGCEEAVPMPAYSRAGSPESVWWYQSCVSHGCNVVGGAETVGWPSYVIDVDAAAHRVMPWLAWARGIQGELYYNTVESWNGAADPWEDVYVHGGNGDGTLFYPGTPERIGGTTHVPVESLRLKVIRDAFEDYEYLDLLSRSAPPTVVRAWKDRIESTLGTPGGARDPDRIRVLRQALARDIGILEDPPGRTESP